MKLSERMMIMATKKRFRTPAIWTVLKDYANEVAQLEGENAKLKNATERLSAEVAYIAAEWFEQTPTPHFPSDHDGIGMALIAYADTLEVDDETE